jgi:integrase
VITLRNPNGFGSVHYLGKGRRKPYRVRITSGWVDGKQVYKTIGYAETRKQGLQMLAEYHNSPYNVERDKITFEDMFNKWCETKEEKLDYKNFRAYKSAYKLCSDIHNVKFADLRKPHLQKMMDGINKSLPTKSKVKTLLRQLYELAMDIDVVTKDYSSGVEVTTKVESMERVPFSPEEIDKLWELSKTNEFARIVLILIYTGVRINELLNLKTENVHLNEHYAIGGSKTKAGKDRIIAIADKIYPFISELYNENNKLLVVSARGGQLNYTTFYAQWLKFMEEHDFKHLIHDTRVTFASLAHAAGVNELNLKRLLGHSNSGNVTHHYIKTDVQLLLEEVNKL